MITKHSHKDITWIDVETPTKEDVANLVAEYKIDPELAQDLVSPTPRPRIDFYKDHIFLILFFPALKHSHAGTSSQEIDFIIGKKFLITVRYDTIDPLHTFAKSFEVNSILEHHEVGTHAGVLFFHMLSKLYRSLSHELESIEDTLDLIQAKIFSGKEKEVVRDISVAHRNLITFRQALGRHDDILQSFALASKNLYGPDFSYLSDILIKEYKKVIDEARSIREFIMELRDTNNSLLNTKQNEVMKILTMLALFTFPLSLILDIFNLHTSYVPIIGNPFDFAIIMTILIGVLVGMYSYFKHKEWV